MCSSIKQASYISNILCLQFYAFFTQIVTLWHAYQIFYVTSIFFYDIISYDL